MTVRPAAGHLLVKPVPTETQTASGILIPATSQSNEGATRVT